MVHKVWVLLWIDFLRRKNQYFVTAAELLLPIGFLILANVTLPKLQLTVDNDNFSFKALKFHEVENCVIKQSHYASIVYEPSTPITDALMSRAACYAGYKKLSVKKGKLDDNSTYFSIGVKFENIRNAEKLIPDFLNYTLYPSGKNWLKAFKLWRFSGLSIPRYSIPSLHNVVELQRAIDVSYLSLRNISTPKFTFENTDLFGRSPRLFSIVIHLTLFMFFALMVPSIISGIVQEKFTGAKELMLMMGIVRWQIWIAKFLNAILFFLLIVSGIVICLYVPMKSDSNILKIPPIIFWSVFMYGLVGVVLFLFCLSCFFKKPSLGVYITEIIVCFLFIFYHFISTQIELPYFVKLNLCLVPHITLMDGISVLLDFDFYGKEIKFTERLSGKNDYLPLSDILTMMTINILIYVILIWYLDQVKPGKFGIAQPYGFCFKKNYWTPNKVDITNKNFNLIDSQPESFESVPTSLQVGISIQSVTKVYKSLDKGPLTAVDNLSLDFYEGEISGLLGHNGAGKTTLFSIITGLTCPTYGKVFINGYDLCLNINEARSSIGLCPQQNMLFSDLTVLQILTFYGVIKGLSLNNASFEANNLIQRLKLEKVKNIQSVNLSGGQKRKVSLGIALIGGSKVLILDEPTSGMDVEIRREIWEILLSLRGSRTILLTTHFMEEADALCDRIAIMDHGKIKCYGTPMFLKSKYSAGYVLSVVIADIDTRNQLTNCIKEYIPSVKFKSQNVQILFYELPENEINNFPALFSRLDEKQKANEIVSYSISLSTLEDVFLRLKGEKNKNLDAVDGSPYKKFDSFEEMFNVSKITGFALCFYQLWALIVKKCIIFRRAYLSFLVYSVLPFSLVMLTKFFSDNKTKTDQSTSDNLFLPYSATIYSPFLVYFSNHDVNNITKSFEDFIRNFNSKARLVPDIKEAVLETFKNDFYTYAKELSLAVNFSSEEINILHNDNAVHMVPVALNIIHNFIMLTQNISGGVAASIGIKFADKELYVNSGLTSKCVLNDVPDVSGMQTMFYLLAPMKEKIHGAKEIQLMMLSSAIYWFSHMLFDIVLFMAFVIVVCICSFTSNYDFMLNHADELFVSFMLWGIGLILIAYIITTAVKNTATAFSVSAIIYIIFSFIIYHAVSLEALPSVFQYFHPTCILKFGFSDLCANKRGNYIWALFLYDVLLFSLLVLKDSKIASHIIHHLLNKILTVRYSTQNITDDLVEKEEEEVKKLINRESTSSAVLIVNDLKRWYLKNFKVLPAVQGISFTVNEGECFGLLGVNGAGKTSTFRMLSGAISSSHGSIHIRSNKLSIFNSQKYLTQIGYCPQFGGLIPSFRGRELLQFFGRLRGLRRSQINTEVRKWLEKFSLLEFADQECIKYSGGNQRKLSAAVALIGNCPLVFLDEPTSGVDPLSRRAIWNIIGSIQKEGQSVVLTSHSMDECEALCTRLAIMVNGSFRCIGETTTLKDRFGQGFCIQLKISNGSDEKIISSLKKSFASSFDPCNLIDEHLTILQYRVTSKTMTWASLFSKLKNLQETFDIVESYTASATNLEQIFIYFARNKI